MVSTQDPRSIQQTEITRPLFQRASEDQSNRIRDESGWMVFLSTLVAVCGSFEFGSSMGFSSPTQAAIIADLGLSLSEYSTFGSILTIGAMAGAITSGNIADYIGRKGAMRMSAVVCIIGWIVIYLSKASWSLDLGRMFGGYGIGVLSYVVPIYIAEITPKNLRGGLTTLNQLMICTGISVAFILGTVLKWRMLAVTGIVPCLILILGLFFIPESPRWLAKVGHQKEFEAALQILRGEGADISEEVREIQVGVGLMVFQQFGGINGIMFYGSELFVSAGYASGNIGIIAIAFIQVPVTALGALLMDRSGRIALLMISATGMFLGCFLVGISFFLKSLQWSVEWVPLLSLIGVLAYVGSFSFGMGGVPWVIMSEVFPINMKGIAGSLVTFVNWFGSWAVSYTFNFMIIWSSAGTFFIFAGICLMAVVFVAKLVPETKGRTLEEIQASMNAFSKERF